MSGTRWWAIVLILTTTIFTSSAQVFYKLASARLPELIGNWPLLLGMACYAIGAVLMLLSFKGGEVSVLYPLLATSYLWVTVASIIVFGEQVGHGKVIGLLFIIAGVSVIGIASKRSAVAMVEVP